MNPVSHGNGNGNGNGTNGLRQVVQKKAASKPSASALPSRDSLVSFRAADGTQLKGQPARISRHALVVEMFSPAIVPRFSEVLEEFKVTLQGREVYSGRAVVRNVVDAGTRVVCEVTLTESHWTDVNAGWLDGQSGQIGAEFKAFLKEWQKLYKVMPEFKVAIADMQDFLHDLRLWLEQVDLKLASHPPSLRKELERKIIAQLAPQIIQSIDAFIERFESLVANFDEQAHMLHYAHLRRQWHSYILTSPFAHRAFTKPLGYAGDYQMVDMMIRSPYEGNGIFAKIINIWLLGQTPAQAHRNRVKHLERRLIEETVRVKSSDGRAIRVFNMGCGPAAEVQRFYTTQVVSKEADLTLMDFNEETLGFMRRRLESIQDAVDRPVNYRLIKKSVHQILKDGGKSIRHPSGENYDYVYCAGLFDYLSDNVCKHLMNIFYSFLAPGGLLLATNASDVLNLSRPFRFSMEYILDWHLIYRDKNRFAAVAPDDAASEEVVVLTENTAANLFLEVRKPKNV